MMAKDPNELLGELFEGMAQAGDDLPELNAAFVQMDQACYVEGELERKYKELIGVAIALYARCEYCMNLHVKQALNESHPGRNPEAAAVAVAFGGSPSMAYLSTTIMKALEAFEE